MATRKKKVSAAELMGKLQSDPLFVAKRAREEVERQEREAEWRLAERPLVDALRLAGFDVESAWDLVNTSVPYPAALPILFAHLQMQYPGVVREAIARALAVPEAKLGREVLVRMYREEQDPHAKDGLAVAISAASEDEVEDLITLACDARNGPSRLLLLNALARSKDPRAYAALMELRTDPALQKEVQIVLRRRKRRSRA